MFKSLFLSLCITWLVSNSIAAKAPFIQKCAWNDRACLKKSAQLPVPKFAAGLPDLGMPPLDPINIDEVLLDQDGLKIQFKQMTVTGLKNSQIVDVERNIDEQWIKLTLETPIEAESTYDASGYLFKVPVEGNGRFHLKTDKLRVSVKVGVSYENGKDGQKYFKLGDREFTYEFVEKTLLDFQNLYGGDEKKAAPIRTILDLQWKESVQTFANTIVKVVMNHVVDDIDIFFGAVPASELEI